MKYLIFSFLLIVISFVSCRKEGNFVNLDNNFSQKSEFSLDDEMIVLGQQLDNPYSVQNMQSANDSLIKYGILNSGEINVTKTHVYIRFLPDNESELNELKNLNIELSELPLDYEIEENGVYYHDPNLLDADITWQYSYVPANFSFPNVQYEILENLFLNDNNAVNTELWETLEEESLKLTNNLDDGVSRSRPSKWNPAGVIKVFDDKIGINIPVEGVKIRVRRWFTFKQAITNANGEFQISHQFRRTVNYRVIWEREEFDIRSGLFGQATVNGPRSNVDWNLTISSGKSKFHAHIFRGAHDYYYNHSVHGLTSPPKKTFWRPRLKIAARYKAGSSNGQCHPATRLFGLYPSIDIFNPTRSSILVYGTTVHEVAHYSHWGLDKSNYNDMCRKTRCKGELRVAESWAEGVEWIFAKWRYSIYGSNTATDDNYQNKKIDAYPYYTPIVVDLIDDENQRTEMDEIFLGIAPTEPFIKGNTGNGNLYYTPLPGNQCPLAGSSFDGTYCFVKYAPNGTIPYIKNGNELWIKFDGDIRYPLDETKGYTISQIEQAMIGSLDFSDWENNLRNNYSNPTEKYLDELFGSWPTTEPKE